MEYPNLSTKKLDCGGGGRAGLSAQGMAARIPRTGRNRSFAMNSAKRRHVLPLTGHADVSETLASLTAN
jgi:hypothetical protein